MFLFIGDGDISRGQMIAPPLELNDAVVSKVDRFKAIVCPSDDTLFDKSRIDMFVDKPASISF